MYLWVPPESVCVCVYTRVHMCRYGLPSTGVGVLGNLMPQPSPAHSQSQPQPGSAFEEADKQIF